MVWRLRIRDGCLLSYGNGSSKETSANVLQCLLTMDKSVIAVRQTTLLRSFLHSLASGPLKVSQTVVHMLRLSLE